jgi:hypothetical protein
LASLLVNVFSELLIEEFFDELQLIKMVATSRIEVNLFMKN